METLGRYHILSELGRGGCGIVYSAFDPRIRRKVAIKTILAPDDAEQAASLLQRFQREAHTAGVLSHPHIVTIYEFDDTGSVIFIVMEFVEGETLAKKMTGGQTITNDFVLTVMAAAGSALDFAHEKGVVHRDVKPANFLITPGGVLKIADFGIAKLASDQGDLTRTGVLIGTPHYMSPEQVGTGAVTGRSDQFSLAVVAYELLTGNKPFQGDSWAAVLHRIMTVDPPPVQHYRQGLSEMVTAVLQRALAKYPADRYPTCTQFVQDLRAAVFGTMEATILQAPPQPLDATARNMTRAITQSAVVQPTESRSDGSSRTAESVPPPAPTVLPAGKSGLVTAGVAALIVVVLIGGWFALRSQSVQAPPAASSTASSSNDRGAATSSASPNGPAGAAGQPSPASPASLAPATPPAPKTDETSAGRTEVEAPTRTPSDASAARAETRGVRGQSGPPSARAGTATARPEPPTVRGATATRTESREPVNATPDRRQAVPAEPRPTVVPPPIQNPAASGPGSAAPATTPPSAPSPTSASGAVPAQPNASGAPSSPTAATAAGRGAGTPESPLAANRRLVDNALARYRSAFESKDLEGLKSVWPGLSRSEVNAFENFFRIARSIKLELRLSGEPTITPDSASVQCRRVMTAADERGPLPAQDQAVTITLRRAGDAMVIESIRVNNR